MLASPKEVKRILNEHGLDARKRFGQNFLIDQNILNQIVEAGQITKEDAVLEIGPGLGTMTVELVKKAGAMLAVEIDDDLISVVEQNVGECAHFKIINEDILKVNLEIIKDLLGQRPIKVVANLPYYITTPILMKLLESGLPIECIVVMIQKEVGDRIAATPGNKQYGALSLGVQTRMAVERVCRVPATAFYPAPNVESIVIKMTRLKGDFFEDIDKELFFKIVKAGFLKRRKTLINALSSENIQGKSKEQIEKILISVQIDPKRRAETLSIEEFKQITAVFNKVMV